MTGMDFQGFKSVVVAAKIRMSECNSYIPAVKVATDAIAAASSIAESQELFLLFSKPRMKTAEKFWQFMKEERLSEVTTTCVKEMLIHVQEFLALEDEHQHFVMQCFIRRLFEEIYVAYIKHPSRKQPSSSASTKISDSEAKTEQAGVRYVAGPVVKKLKNKYGELETCQHFFKQCIPSPDQRRDENEWWTVGLDRGGLFPVTSICFWFFYKLNKLISPIYSNPEKYKEKIIEQAVDLAPNDQKLLQHWWLLWGEQDSEQGLQILKEAVRFFVILRSKNFAKQLNDLHKAKLKSTRKKKKANKKSGGLPVKRNNRQALRDFIFLWYLVATFEVDSNLQGPGPWIARFKRVARQPDYPLLHALGRGDMANYPGLIMPGNVFTVEI